ncbi:MAG: hypothetical protein ACI9MB_004909, partial [Verrucomicrobiales bacterium]
MERLAACCYVSGRDAPGSLILVVALFLQEMATRGH